MASGDEEPVDSTLDSSSLSVTTEAGEESSEAHLELAPEWSDVQYLNKVHAQIATDKSRTENSIAIILVWAIVVSLPILLIAVVSLPASSQDLQAIFDRWITLVGPLAGAAVGYGAKRIDRAK